MTEAEILRQFAREMLGSSVAHMTDEQLDAWMEPWRAMAESDASMTDYPPAWMKKLDDQRQRLLAVLRARSAGCGGDPN